MKANFHITNVCDMKCKFCFKTQEKNSCNDVIISTFHSVCKKFGCVNLVGGEVFLFPKLVLELTKIAKKYNVKISIISNGYNLYENLYDEITIDILKNIDTLGISVDSFSSEYNLSIGRSVNQKTLTVEKLSNIINLSKYLGCEIKINTVLTSKNFNEKFDDKFSSLEIDKWKVFEVMIYNKKYEYLRPNKDQIDLFLKNNKMIDIQYEESETLKYSYINILGNGNLFINNEENKIISNIYDNDFEYMLKNSNFNFKLYNLRYT